MRFTDPVENVRTYVRVHRGLDQQERLKDVEWIEDVVKHAKEVVRLRNTDSTRQAIDKLKNALNE